MEEQIVFIIFAIVFLTAILGLFRVNLLVAMVAVVFTLAFWWTLFFVLFGR